MQYLEEITEKAFNSAVKRAAEAAIAPFAGHLLRGEIIEIIKAEARRMLEEDAELKLALREALKSWIRSETAAEYLDKLVKG